MNKIKSIDKEGNFHLEPFNNSTKITYYPAAAKQSDFAHFVRRSLLARGHTLVGLRQRCHNKQQPPAQKRVKVIKKSVFVNFLGNYRKLARKNSHAS